MKELTKIGYSEIKIDDFGGWQGAYQAKHGDHDVCVKESFPN